MVKVVVKCLHNTVTTTLTPPEKQSLLKLDNLIYQPFI